MKTQPRILIVGSTGYLGSNIVEFLMAQHAEFKALARNKTKGPPCDGLTRVAGSRSSGDSPR